MTNDLPRDIRYIVNIYSDFTEGLDEGELTFPDSPSLNQATGIIDSNAVVDLLWVDGAIPVWINVSIEDFSDGHSIATLECCGRFSAFEKHWYHKEEGYMPFHALSPPIPPRIILDKENGSLSEKFDMRWRENS